MIAVTAIAAACLRAVHAPAPLLLGPMAAGVAFGLYGSAIRPPPLAFGGAQVLLGCLIATTATPAFYAGVAAHFPVYLLLAGSTLAITTAMGWIMTTRRWLPGTTAIWGMAPGASTAMVILSEAFGGDRRIVAMMQYLRLLAVALAAMALAHFWGGSHRSPAAAGWLGHAGAWTVAVTLLFAAAAGGIGKISRLPAGVFLVPMLAGSALQATGVLDLAVPPAVSAAAYAVIGWSIGLGFTKEALIYSARLMPRILLAVAVLIAACGVLALGVSALTGVDFLSAYLATSPGGTDTILIIAASTPVDLPFILGGQLVRFLLVLLVGPVVARMLHRSLPPQPENGVSGL